MNATDNLQSPISRYMKKNNFSMLIQESLRKPQQSLPHPAQPNPLQQFQKPLQTQHTTYNQLYTSTNKPASPPLLFQPQQFPTPSNELSGVPYRSSQTLLYGDQLMTKLRNFIICQDTSRRPKTSRHRKVEQSSYDLNSSIQKLHDDHRVRQNHRREQYTRKEFYDEMEQMRQFRVTNPISLCLIQQHLPRDAKPLYERAVELAKEKTQQRMQKHVQKQMEERIKEDEEILKYQRIRREKYPDSHKLENQEQFYNELVKKEKIKNHDRQHQRMNHLKQITKQKPYVSKVSKQLFSKILERDQLSGKFLERNQQYQAQRQKQRLVQLKEYQKQYYPFSPQIIKASRHLAQKYYDRKQGQQNIKQKQQSTKQKQQVIKQQHHNPTKQTQHSIKQTLQPYNRTQQAIKQTPQPNYRTQQAIKQTPQPNYRTQQAIKQTPQPNNRTQQAMKQTPLSNNRTQQTIKQTPQPNNRTQQAIKQTPHPNNPHPPTSTNPKPTKTSHQSTTPKPIIHPRQPSQKHTPLTRTTSARHRDRLLSNGYIEHDKHGRGCVDHGQVPVYNRKGYRGTSR